VRQDPAENIVAFLSFSGDHCAHDKAIEKFTRGEWEHVKLSDWISQLPAPNHLVDFRKSGHISGGIAIEHN